MSIGRRWLTARGGWRSSPARCGSRRVLTLNYDRGTVTGLGGGCGAGAVLVDADRPLRFDRVTVGWTAIFTTGQRVGLRPRRYVNTHSPADHSGSYSVPSEGLGALLSVSWNVT